MNSTRQRGAIAKVIDHDALLELGRKAFAEKYPTENPESLQGLGDQMMFTVNHGEIAVVNVEGVGHIADENEKVNIYFTQYMSYIEVEIDLSELGGAVTDKEIDLADGIRTFGSRLDSNHYRWFHRYEGK